MNAGESKLKVEYIPPNFREGVSLFGFMIRISYVIQAVPFVGMIVLAVLLAGKPLNGLVKLVLIIVLSAPVVFISATGINGDSLFRFLFCMIRAGREKPTYLYNPRVKLEIKPLPEEPDQKEKLPREKIQEFLEKKRKNREDKADYKKFTFEHMVFEDDDHADDKKDGESKTE